MRIDELLERYRELRLSYFSHGKATPWEKREKQLEVETFLNDLEVYLLGKKWAIEKRNEGTRIYGSKRDSRIFLKIRHYIDYFGFRTVYLIEIYLMKKRGILWDRVLADGELAFDYLKRMP
ncbi:MAG: hypothetical protein GTN81_07790 [Proteobacteria bacterium]|nr:hypothetical protein [Pseudomonadota bacterium]